MKTDAQHCYNCLNFLETINLKSCTQRLGIAVRQGIHCCVCPQPLMNKDIKVKDNKQKSKDACPAQTEADSELQPKITTSCPACSNTFVVGSFTV